jgi:hypothetical protein
VDQAISWQTTETDSHAGTAGSQSTNQQKNEQL